MRARAVAVGKCEPSSKIVRVRAAAVAAGVNDAKAGVNENRRPKKAISSSRWTHTLTVRAHARGSATAEYLIQRAAGAD